ncbi:MAG: hypothetical protein QGG79_03905 [Dehalococcoidales bacterium]|nr:hypothetical protein [Dehalococcoidales bacterium]MDP7286280.1 hypothetical protein [Dehalococcoidales bacterium]
MMTKMIEGYGVKAHNEPAKRLIGWPSMTLLGTAVTFLIMVKTMKMLALMEAMTIACSMFNNRSMIKTTIVARKLW